MSEEKKPRKSKMWFVVHNGIHHARGYECLNAFGEPQKAWYVPSLGFTMFEGDSLFETKNEAVGPAVKELEKEIKETEKQLRYLRDTLKGYL